MGIQMGAMRSLGRKQLNITLRNIVLTYWLLADAAANLDLIYIECDTRGRYVEYFLWNCSQVIATGPHRWLINIVSCNGLVPDKALLDPVCTLSIVPLTTVIILYCKVLTEYLQATDV